MLAMSNRNHFEYLETEKATTLTIYTKSPTKWLLIDRETGQVYQGSDSGNWDRLDPIIKQQPKD